ncbi:MAG: protease inhibitor I42 family protein [Gaiellaceae bacterium]
MYSPRHSRWNPRALLSRARGLAAVAALVGLACIAAISIRSTQAGAAVSCEAVPVVNPSPGEIYEYDNVTSTSAILSAYIDTNHIGDRYFDTDYFFTVYDHMNQAVAITPVQTIRGSATPTPVEQTITGLNPGDQYYFDLTATNFCGPYEPPDPLVPPKDFSYFQTLSRVDVGIDGDGTVSRSGGSLTCSGTSCTTDFDSFSTSVTLNASPASGMLFLGWTGACNTSSTTCTISKLGASAAIAHFGLAPLLNVITGGTGSGKVTSSPGGITCASGSGNGCSASFPFNTTVTLTAVPDAGSMFTGWGSDETSCSSSAPVCTKKLSTSTYVTAMFAPAFELVVSVDGGSGSGKVTSVPTGISCPGICNAYFAPGTEVELTATPNPNSSFVGWDGVCFDRSSQAPCSIVVYGDTELNAEFSNPLVDLAGAGAVVRADQRKNGKGVAVKRGDLLIVSLPANSSTGFGWHVKTLDRKALKLMSSGYVNPTPKATPALGVPGTYTASFRALKKGKTTLTLAYSRASGKAVRTYKLRVVVR